MFGLLPGVRRVFPLGGRVFQMPERHEETGLRLLSAGMVAAAHARGAQVHLWTVNDRTDMERFLDLGVDGIVSDDLETLRSVLIGRDLWEERMTYDEGSALSGPAGRPPARCSPGRCGTGAPNRSTP